MEFDSVCVAQVNDDEFPIKKSKLAQKEIVEDERVLMYVVVARAKEELIITYDSSNPISTFIKELERMEEVVFVDEIDVKKLPTQE